MFFNSVEYLLFVPIVVFVYFLLTKKHFVKAANYWLIFSSLFFYGFLNYKYIPLILLSITFNYILGKGLMSEKNNCKKALLVFGIILNLCFLAYFKYINFFISNINAIFSAHINFLKIALPIGISFFTFQQISYLVDCKQGKTGQYSLTDYLLFILPI